MISTSNALSHLHPAAGRALANRHRKLTLYPDLFERESLEERSVGIREAGPLRTQPLEGLAGQKPTIASA
jgi:hypothetical protein